MLALGGVIKPKCLHILKAQGYWGECVVDISIFILFDKSIKSDPIDPFLVKH